MAWSALDQTWHYVEKWAIERPNKEAIVFEDERLTWRDFKTQMDLVAKAYLEAGIQKGDRVAFLSMARSEFLTTYMAAGKVGAIWLGLNPKFTADELRYQLNDSRPSILITLRSFKGEDLSERVKSLMGECPFIKKVLVIGEPFEGTENFHQFVSRPRVELDEALEKRSGEVTSDDSALLMYTSGSTGKPKGVVHTHRSIIENIKVEIKKFYCTENTRALLHFPINHVAADVEIGFACIMSGGCVVMMDSFDPIASMKVVEKEKITMLGQVPVMFLLQMKQPDFMTTDWSSVKYFIWAGSAAPKLMIDVLSSICQKTGASLITGYGSTEVCGFVTYTEKGDDLETLIKTAGKIAEPFELKIVDDDRNELPDGEVGEIAVRGPFLFKEYLNRPEETARVMDKEGWYYTNDLAFKDSRGYIHITGRKSEMFKSGGENVFPREVEEVLEGHQSVLFAAVIGVPDEVYQEVGWAFIMPQPGKEVTEDELKALCRSKLANYKIPKKFFIRQVLPLLPNGKVNKVDLHQLLVQQFSAREQ
ncbi:MAG: acyl--CoA ligase [Deltaproteobacteria bacterium]|nr:acyl--CoA ligase [Deltaproteobacteria bacterium]